MDSEHVRVLTARLLQAKLCPWTSGEDCPRCMSRDSQITPMLWRVPQLDPADPGSGNATAQLFTGKKSIPLEIFVREDLQNRVDARLSDEKPARVRIHRRELPGALIAKYFPDHFWKSITASETGDLEAERVAARLSQIEKLRRSQTLPVLVIEDRGTTGLNGPVNSKMPVKQVGLPLYHATNALTCFLRRNGSSGKTGKSLGSAGLGRIVYYKASEISTKLVYTLPSDMSFDRGDRLESVAPRPLFFGQSFQREQASRSADGKQSFASAYHHLTSALADVSGFPMPFGVCDEERQLVEAARQDFQLARANGESGCSIVIPYPKANLTDANFVKVIVREFALPILLGQLEVEVGDTTIRRGNVANLSDDEAVNGANQFFAAALDPRAQASVRVPFPRAGTAMTSDLFEAAAMAELSSRWKQRDLVKVDFEIEFGPRATQRGVARVALQRCESGTKGRALVARNGLPLSAYSDVRSLRPWNGSTMLGTDPLGCLLRACETPAHDRWIHGDIDPADCADPEQVVRFVSTAHLQLAALLDGLDTEDDLSVFADVLPGHGGKPPTPPLVPPFSLGLAQDGQTVRLTIGNGYDSRPGTKWRIVIVYDSILGSSRARKSFRRGEFDLESVPCRVTGGRVEARSGCSVTLVVSDPEVFEFHIGPCGFSDWADVRLHAEREDD